MSLANPFQFLIDYYFFEDRYYCAENFIICTSHITGQQYRIRNAGNGGFGVDLNVRSNKKTAWETQMTVADIQSVLGVVDDCEEIWRKRHKKKQKNQLINEA